MNNIAIIVAILSALLSLGSLIVSVIAYKRDNPKLKITPHYSIDMREPPTLGLDITNIGKRPTTIVQAGFRVNAKLTMKVFKNGKSGDYTEVPFQKNLTLHADPILINPGEIKRLRLVLNEWPDPMIHADMPLRAFATSSHGKTIWGPSNSWLREIIDSRGQKPANIHPEFIKPLPDKFVPLPVYAKWKIWHPKSLR